MRYIPYYKVVPTKTLIQTSPTVHIHPGGLRNSKQFRINDYRCELYERIKTEELNDISCGRNLNLVRI